MIRGNIAAGNIKARCLARRYDAGQSCYIDLPEVLDPSWLTFLAYAEPEDDHLRFDTAAAAEAIIRGLVKFASHWPPERARNIEIDGQRLNVLHPRPTGIPPGPKPALRLKISNKMFDDLVNRIITSADLHDMKLAALAARYGAKTGTARVARQDALTRFSEMGNSEPL